MYRKNIFFEKKIKIESEKIFMFAEIIYKAQCENLRIATIKSKMQLRKYGQPSHTKISLICKTFYEMIDFWYRNVFIKFIKSIFNNAF